MDAVNINGTWRHRFNSELYKLYREPDIMNYIKINQMKFARHLCRINLDSPISRESFALYLSAPMLEGGPNLDELTVLRRVLEF